MPEADHIDRRFPWERYAGGIPGPLLRMGGLAGAKRARESMVSRERKTAAAPVPRATSGKP